MTRPVDDDPTEAEDREAILARRKRFVAAAIAGLTTSTLATACPCLDVAPPDPGTGTDSDDSETGSSSGTATDDSGTGGTTSTGP